MRTFFNLSPSLLARTIFRSGSLRRLRGSYLIPFVTPYSTIYAAVQLEAEPVAVFLAGAVNIRRAQANLKVTGVEGDVMDVKSVSARSLQACDIPVTIQMQAWRALACK
jgi:hypothetical protein